MDKKTLSRFLIPVIVGALIWFSPIPNGVSPDAWHILAMMTAIIVGFIAVPVNIGCVAFIGLMAVMLTGTLSPGAALKGFSNTLLWLIVTAFLFSRAFVKTGLGERISLWILSKIGDSSLKVAYGLTISGSLLAAGIPSGTARACGVIYPILRSICSALGSEPDKNPDKIGRFLIQSYFQSEAFISYLFLTAMAGNVLVMQFAQDLANVSITWGGWAVGAFLPAIVSIILVPYCTYLLVPPQLKKAPEAKAAAQRMYAALGPVKPQEKLLFGIFCFSIIMWMLGDFTGIGSTLVALIAVSAMLLMGILTWEDVLGESGAWNTLMWMGVLVCLASALTEKGFMVWLGNSMGAMFTGMNWMLVTFLVCLFFNYSQYAFASSTAHMVALYGACLAILLAAGCPPMVAILLLAYIANTPACLTQYTGGFCPIFYGAGYFNTTQWWKIGFIMSWLHFAIVIVVGPIWWKVVGFW